jgi:hypothetical protein
VNTLLLDIDTWDLCADASGNIAVASEPYALAQDAATAIRTFLKDCYYDQTDGIDYFGEILGHTPPLRVFQQLMVNATLSASPDIVSAQCIVNSFDPTIREASGQVLFVDTSGNTGSVSF